ncbi:hypothetical protein LINPERPRIM_LOCUS10237 [Linum perenne]
MSWLVSSILKFTSSYDFSSKHYKFSLMSPYRVQLT